MPQDSSGDTILLQPEGVRAQLGAFATMADDLNMRTLLLEAYLTNADLADPRGYLDGGLREGHDALRAGRRAEADLRDAMRNAHAMVDAFERQDQDVGISGEIGEIVIDDLALLFGVGGVIGASVIDDQRRETDLGGSIGGAITDIPEPRIDRGRALGANSVNSAPNHRGSVRAPDKSQWLINEIARDHYMTTTSFDLNDPRAKAAALFFFYQQVHKGGKWDYKSNILKAYSQSGILLFDKKYANDVPGNIVYGYMGRVVGLDESLLADAAGYAQFKEKTKGDVHLEDMALVVRTNLNYPGLWARQDDPLDQNAIRIGIRLYEDKDLSSGHICHILEAANLRPPPK